MSNEFDDEMESLEEMFDYIHKQSQETQMMNLSQEMNLMNVQIFMKCFGKFLSLSPKQQQQFEQCILAFNDEENDPLIKQSALAWVYDLLIEGKIEQNTNEKEISRKDDKIHQTPCEDCEQVPTRLVQFKQENRTEEHFLCESCEQTAYLEDTGD